MKSVRILALGLLVALAGSIPLSTAHADTWDKATKVTFSEPVQIPGTVLPPGTYTFTLADSQSNRHIVQIYNDTRTQLITTVLAIPNYQLQPAGKTILEFAERPSGQPIALQAWFYPGDNFGQEFVYPKSEAAQLSQMNGSNVPSTDESTPAPAPAQPVASEPATTPQPEAAAPVPVAQEPAQTAPVTSDTPTQPQSSELPKTGSDLPLFALAGFVALGGALVLHKVTRGQS
ncbi:MAG: LPXTG cell wall anchor domain-containing protein [Candidatus Acidiferrales bacterium]